jgi:predicted transcriptional regulator
VVSADQSFKGIISSSNLFSNHHDPATQLRTLIKRKHISVSLESSLRTAVEMMARENVDVLPVASGGNQIVGVLAYKISLPPTKGTLKSMNGNS